MRSVSTRRGYRRPRPRECGRQRCRGRPEPASAPVAAGLVVWPPWRPAELGGCRIRACPAERAGPKEGQIAVPKGILYVETRPASAEQVDEYHRWYNETHINDILSVDGFVSARRFESLGDDGTFIAIYEIEADDLDQARANLAAASGQHSAPVGVCLDPPPTVRYFKEIASFPKG